MKEMIEEFQSKNGSVRYSTKELLQALHIKIDRVDDKVYNIVKTVASKRMVIGMFGFLIALIGALARHVIYGGK